MEFPTSFGITRFFYRQHFYKQHQPEIGKNQANAKQHPEAELLLFENYSHFLSENNRKYSRKETKEQVFLYS